jgi:hypothetical protein
MELVFWAIHLLYEFTVKGKPAKLISEIGRKEIRSLPHLPRYLMPILHSEDTFVVSATLRTMCLLSFQDTDFQKSIIDQPGAIKRIMCWFKCSNEEIYYSALLLLHILMEHGTSC